MICPRCQHPLSVKKPTLDGWQCMAMVRPTRGAGRRRPGRQCRCTKSPLKLRASLLRASLVLLAQGLVGSVNLVDSPFVEVR